MTSLQLNKYAWRFWCHPKKKWVAWKKKWRNASEMRATPIWVSLYSFFFLSSRNKNGGYVNSNFFYISQADINVIDHCMRFSCGLVTDRLSLALVSFTPCLGFWHDSRPEACAVLPRRTQSYHGRKPDKSVDMRLTRSWSPGTCCFTHELSSKSSHSVSVYT